MAIGYNFLAWSFSSYDNSYFDNNFSNNSGYLICSWCKNYLISSFVSLSFSKYYFKPSNDYLSYSVDNKYFNK